MAGDYSHSGIMAEGEQHRSPQFKAARAKLVAEVNGWLGQLAAWRNGGRPLADGQFMILQSRVSLTDLGPTRGGRALLESMTPGLSLTGDGRTKPYVFQSVSKDAAEATAEVVEVSGSDPVAMHVYGEYWDLSRQLETVAAFGQRTTRKGSEEYYRFRVTGDGAVKREFFAGSGRHTTAPVRTVGELATASTAFASVRQMFPLK